jgi:hypothetical protein
MTKIYAIESYTTLYCIPGTTRCYDGLGDLEAGEGWTEEDYEIVDAPAGVDGDYGGAFWPYVD